LPISFSIYETRYNVKHTTQLTGQSLLTVGSIHYDYRKEGYVIRVTATGFVFRTKNQLCSFIQLLRRNDDHFPVCSNSQYACIIIIIIRSNLLPHLPSEGECRMYVLVFCMFDTLLWYINYKQLPISS